MPQGIFQGFSEGFTGGGGLSTAVARSRQSDIQSRQVGVQEKQVGLREKELAQKAQSDKVKNKLDAVKVFSAGMSNPDQADELIIQNAKGLYAAMGLKLPDSVTVEQLKPSVATAKKMNNILQKGAPTRQDTRNLKALSIQLQTEIGNTSEAAQDVITEANRIEDQRREDDTLQLTGLIQRNATAGGQASPEDAQAMLLIKNRNPDTFPAMMEEAKQQIQTGQGGGASLTPTVRTRIAAQTDPAIAQALKEEEASKIRVAESLGAGREKGKLLVRTKKEAGQQLAALDNIESLFDKKFVGPIQGGFLGKAKSKTGIGLTKEEASFRAAVKKNAAELKRLYFGTAQTAIEMKNSIEAIPDTNMPDIAFQAAIEQTRVNVRNTLAGLEDGSITVRGDEGSPSFSPEDAAELETLLR